MQEATPMVKREAVGGSRTKWIVLLVGVLGGLLFAPSPGRAQSGPDLPSVSPRIEALFERIPASDPEAQRELSGLLLGTTADEVRELCRLLLGGAGELELARDHEARLTLHALCMTGSAEPAAGKEVALRSVLRDVFLEQIRQEPVDEAGASRAAAARGFLIEQLHWIAVPDDLARLPDFGGTPHFAEVVRLVVGVGGEAAKKFLRRALRDHADHPWVEIVVVAVGSLRDRDAVSDLLALLSKDDPSPALREAVVTSLVRVGAPEAEPLLWEELEANDPTRNPDATRAYNRVGGKLIELAARLDDGASLRVYERLHAGHTAAVRIASLRGLLALRGVAAVPSLLEDLTSDHYELRGAALDSALALGGAEVSGAFAALVKQEGLSVAARVALLEVLGARGHRMAVPAVVARLEDPQAAVREAAIEALVTLEGAEAEDALVGRLVKGAGADPSAALDDATFRAIERALSVMVGSDLDRKIAAAALDQSPEVALAGLRILRKRGAHAQLGAVHGAASNSDERVRSAAFRALGKLGDDHSVTLLLERLPAAEGAERKAIEKALGSLCEKPTVAESAEKQIVAALNESDTQAYCSMVRALGRASGADALAALSRAATDSRADVQEASFRAFGHWQGADAAPTLLELAERASSIKAHVLGLRAYAELIKKSNQGRSERVVALQAGFQASRRADEKKFFLARIGEQPDPQSIEVLRPALSSDELRAEAAAAMLRVVEGMMPARKMECRMTLRSLESPDLSAEFLERVAAVQRRLESFDYVTDWWVTGPYSRPSTRGNDLLDIAFGPELAVAEASWKRQPVIIGDYYWRMDLDLSIGGDHRAAYLFTWVVTPREVDVVFELGSDDGIKVWVNEVEVHRAKVARGCTPGADQVPVTLRPGRNAVLLKVTDLGGGWAACLRLRTPQGQPVPGLFTTAESPPE